MCVLETVTLTVITVHWQTEIDRQTNGEGGDRQRQRQRERERERGREASKQTDIMRVVRRERDMHTDKETETEIERRRDKERDRDRKRDRDRGGREAGREPKGDRQQTRLSDTKTGGLTAHALHSTDNRQDCLTQRQGDSQHTLYTAQTTDKTV